MRIILTILFLWVYSANATNYYVSNSGNDSNDGLTTATAWQTLSKVNSSTFIAGDSILLKRGDSWNERLTLKSSGNAGNPIVVSAYGSGAKPLITGLQAVSLTNVGNIWSGIVTNAVANLNTVLVDGKIQAKGRYPNATATNGGYLTFQSSTQTSITSSSLTGTPSYVGKECVVRTAAWILDVIKVASQSTSTLNFSTPLTYNPSSSGGNGFFFQNDSTFLDVQGEWSYDSAKKLCVYSTASPVVQVSTIDTLIYVNGHSYITFDNLSVQGANLAAFQFDSLSNITVQNCSVNNSGTLALSAQKSSYLSALNDSIQNSLSGAIYWRRVDPYTPMQDTCNYATITNTYIKNTAIYAGMGLNNNGRYMGIDVVGRKPLLYNNIIDSTGYAAIIFNGDPIVKNNYISNYNFVKDDGGGIYTVVGSYIPADYNNGSIIRKNLVVNGIGALNGVQAGWSHSPGIYLDNSTKNIIVDSNTIYNTQDAGLYLNEADSNTVINNNIYNSTGNVFYYLGSNSYISAGGNQIKNNAVYSTSSLYNIYRQNGTNLGNIDSNYYSRPSNESNRLNLNGTTYDLAGWQSASGKDLHTHGTPLGVIGNPATIVYNPTQNDSTIYFANSKISIRNVSYKNSITLAPFTSAILFDAIIPKQYQYKHYR
jgi:parallel beta-helix repeat protein